MYNTFLFPKIDINSVLYATLHDRVPKKRPRKHACTVLWTYKSAFIRLLWISFRQKKNHKRRTIKHFSEQTEKYLFFRGTKGLIKD